MGNSKGTSRREFLKLAAVAGGAAATTIGLSGCSSTASGQGEASQTDGITWDREVEAIVIGAGAGGTSAAIELADQGIDVILLESESDNTTNSTALSGGYVSMAETPLCPHPREELVKDLIHAARSDCQEDLIQTYAENSVGMYDRLESFGVEYLYAEIVGEMHYPWPHACGEANSGYLMGKLTDATLERDVEILMDTRVTDLVLDENKRVIGVKAGTETPVYYKASRGVIITTGDFTRNEVLKKAFGPIGADRIVPVTGLGCRGDGYLMATRIGAAPSFVSAGTQPTLTIGLDSHSVCLQNMVGAISVGMSGKRYTDESQDYIAVARKAILENSTCFHIYDSAIRAIMAEHPHPPFALPLQEEITSDTIEGLGEAIKAKFPDFDASALVEQVTRYNNDIATTGSDQEFGRTNAEGTTGDIMPIAEGPFYAIALGIGAVLFAGGLKIDKDARVINMEDEAIPGLYAAGGCIGGVSGWGYMTGSCVGTALIFGQVAAKTLADDSK